MSRRAAVRLAGLAAAVASLLVIGAGPGAPEAPAAARETILLPEISVTVLGERDDRTWLRVRSDGVAFDGDRVGDGARLEYTARPPRSDQAVWFGRELTDAERRAGWAAFTEAPAQFPDGYCISWLRLGNAEWGEWMSGPVCWEPPAREQSGGQDDPQDAEPTAEPSPTATAGSRPGAAPGSGSGRKPAAATPAAEKSPAPEPSPTPTPAPSPSAPSSSPSPTASSSPSASGSPSPGLPASRGDAASGILDTFQDQPVHAEGETTSPPRAGDLTWLWVLLAGFAAAAGGVVIMLRRPS
ncbi:hypothetical protein [Myceligenerans crystallogenes]|uniref:Gram-positive cocci surface proteins LPxTG domain-containing protein n=1 Tax=Myceligenerans crystallogenes TaxID=316335 RepID=A0ABP4ZAU5_9MICO